MNLNKHKIKLSIIIIASLCVLCSCSKESTETGATNHTSSSTTSDNTTSVDSTIAYTFDNGTTISKDELLFPVKYYDNICSTGNSEFFNMVYPDEVLDFCVKSAKKETSSDYAIMLYDLYKQIYGEDFTMSNEFLQCEPLSDDELADFSEFYNSNVGVTITPDYGFIVTSNFSITYKDEDGSETTDSDIDFYIAYYYDGQMYLDYLYIDTLDL